MMLVDSLPFLMLGALAILLFTGLPVAFILSGIGVAACLIGIAIGEMPWAALYSIVPKMVYAVSGTPFYPAVVMLLFMGVALEKSGIAGDMLACLRLVLQRVPGGLAIAVLIIGVLIAPAAGVVGASVVTISMIALPTMLANGYRATAASGAIAAAGTVGIIMPPAVMLFFLSGKFQVPIGSMFMATVVPGAILIACYMLYYVVQGWLIGPKMQPVSTSSDTDNWPKSPMGWSLLLTRGLVMPVALLCLILGAIISGWATPSQAGGVGAAGGLVLIILSGRLSWPMFKDLIRTTYNLSAMVFFIIMSAAVFSYPFRYFGGDFAIKDLLAQLSMGPWPTLMLILSIIFVLGFFIDWIEITVVTLPIFVPVLSGLDFAAHVDSAPTTMLWMAAVVALVLQTSFLTPPFGFALFFLKGSAPPSVRLSDIYVGIVPILVLQLLVITLVLTFPVLSSWLPELVYGN